MQPTLCSRCKKNVAVVFISKLDGDKTVNEGLCLKCAKDLGLPQVDDMMKRMGISDEDLETLNSEMMQAFNGVENIEDLPGGDEDSGEEEDGKTATFPFLNRLFSGGDTGRESTGGEEPSGGARGGREKEIRKDPKGGKRKYLENYCISLTQKAKDGKLDPVIGRTQEIERVVQILNRRQKNNPCLIGEPGVGKT
ncbi:MAG: ATP-dependent Clp protease ATP-binding subunit, partial [Oscillospiraceae bacterium]|nr:ATP-dependent Clp protease ATP-binding subunit [Oscillospiraceae bacterium]